MWEEDVGGRRYVSEEGGKCERRVWEESGEEGGGCERRKDGVGGG